MANLPNGSKGELNLGSLDCESGVLPLSYRAPQSHQVTNTICAGTLNFVFFKLVLEATIASWPF